MTQINRYRVEQQPLASLKMPRPITILQCQTTASTAATARDDADFHIQTLVLSNVTGTDETATLYIVPSGGSPGAANMIVSQIPVSARSLVYICDGEKTLIVPPSATLRALCSTNDAINLYGWGLDYQGTYG